VIHSVQLSARVSTLRSCDVVIILYASKIKVKKLQDKVEKCRKDVDATRERYNQSLSELNGYNAKYIEDMTEVFQRTQEFEHRRLTFIKKTLYDLLACVDLTQYKA